VRPARAVRPTRCVYERDEVGRSKFITQATSTKSTPRVTPYSLSLPLLLRSLRSRLRDFDLLMGGEGERFRFRMSGLDELGSEEGVCGVGSCTGSRWVDVTTIFR